MFVKNISTIFIIFMLLATPVFALELDTSVDDEIRRTYDPSKLEQSLPALPKTAPTQQNTVPKNTSDNTSSTDSSEVHYRQLQLLNLN